MNWPLPFLTSSTQKLINQLLAFLNLYQHAKSQLIPFVCFWDTVITAHRPDCQHPFLTLSKQKTFKQHFCAFVSTCKKRGYFIYLFRRNSWFKNPAIWLAESILAYIFGTKFFVNLYQHVRNQFFHLLILQIWSILESGVVACTCNLATLEAEFRNRVGSIPVGGNSPSMGGWIKWPPVIQH